MVGPAHIGLEHPSLLWLVGIGIVAFIAGLGVNLYRSPGEEDVHRGPVPEDDRAE